MYLHDLRHRLLRLTCLGTLVLFSQGTMARDSVMSQAFNKDHLLAYVVAAFLIGLFVLIYYNLLFHYREEDAKAMNKRQNMRLALVMMTSHLRLWIYDVSSRHYFLLSETGDYTEEYNPIDFSLFFNRDDFEMLRKLAFDVTEGRKNSGEVSVRSAERDGEPARNYVINVSKGQVDNNGKILDLLCIQRDVTDETRRKENVSQLLMRYHTVFNSSLEDMVYYSSDGMLRDINDKACATFGIKDRAKLLEKGYSLHDSAMYVRDSEQDGILDSWTTAFVNFGKSEGQRYIPEGSSLNGKMYYESIISSILNEQGQVEGIYMAGRNVTEMVESYHRQQEGSKVLAQTIKTIQDNIRNTNYALQVSNVRLVKYYPKRFTLEISSNINETQLTFSQLRCIRLGAPHCRRQISSALNRMDHLTEHPIVVNIETEFHDNKGRPICLMFNMVPVKDQEGQVDHYFGICRDMTEIVETEKLLAAETKKAQETESLKQAFLTNMSYEIRTPLNTVVGFAELFESDHDEADEPLFVEEIKRNSNDLLKLVNDILFLSRLDANIIEYNKVDNDFAMLFDGFCQMGFVNVGAAVNTIIENPYEHLVVDIDQEYLSKAIRIICQGAVSNTSSGTIRTKYEYRHGELTISIADTGKGYDSDALTHIFDRFVQSEQDERSGTGLDFPIAKTIIEQMGGTIEIQSQKDKGTTAWIIIPCEAKTIEMRRQLTT